MDFDALWKLLGLGIEADLEKHTWTLKIGPITIKGLRIPVLKALAKDSAAIENILSLMFIQREVMWEDYRAESVPKCIGSLRSLQGLCEKAASDFNATGKEQDKIISTMCRGWANQCDAAASDLEGGLDAESDPANTGMGVSARDYIPDALGTLRKKTYPTIEFLIGLLPEKNMVREQATEVLNRGKDEIIRHYNVSVSDIPKASAEAENGSIAMTPEEAQTQIRKELTRIAGISERLGFRLDRRSQTTLADILTTAHEAGKLRNPTDITIASAAFVGANISLLQTAGSGRISPRTIMRTWNETLSVGGNCPPHECIEMSILRRFDTLKERHPHISQLLTTEMA
jgi:hypothetical protein